MAFLGGGACVRGRRAATSTPTSTTTRRPLTFERAQTRARGRFARSTVRAVAVEERGTAETPYKIAVLKGDGAGPQLAEMTIKVLRALEQYTDLHFDFDVLDFGSDAHERTGEVLPQESVDACRRADAVLRAPQGSSRGTHTYSAGHQKLLEQLDLFVQLRPVKVFPQLTSASSFKPELVEGLDLLLVREVSAGALGSTSSEGSTGDNMSSMVMSYTKEQVQRVANVAFQIAEARSGSVLNVDKAYAIRVSAFWRETLHRFFRERTTSRSDIQLSDMFIDDFCREALLNPKQFDVIVTSNLFGDILSEVIAGFSGPIRLAPSTWISSSGLHVCGPADIYNSAAYTGGTGSTGTPNPIAMLRSASMLLRYALDEPAAADLVQQALMRTMAEFATSDMQPHLDVSRTIVSATSFAETVANELELMHQFEMVCDPVICGE